MEITGTAAGSSPAQTGLAFGGQSPAVLIVAPIVTGITLTPLPLPPPG